MSAFTFLSAVNYENCISLHKEFMEMVSSNCMAFVFEADMKFFITSCN